MWGEGRRKDPGRSTRQDGGVPVPPRRGLGGDWRSCSSELYLLTLQLQHCSAAPAGRDCRTAADTKYLLLRRHLQSCLSPRLGVWEVERSQSCVRRLFYHGEIMESVLVTLVRSRPENVSFQLCTLLAARENWEKLQINISLRARRDWPLPTLAINTEIKQKYQASSCLHSNCLDLVVLIPFELSVLIGCSDHFVQVPQKYFYAKTSPKKDILLGPLDSVNDTENCVDVSCDIWSAVLQLHFQSISPDLQLHLKY